MIKKENIDICDLRTESCYDVVINSDIGKRETQQDAAYVAVNNESVFAIICDGMGGLQGGERASSTAIEAFTEFFVDSDKDRSTNEWMQKALEEVDYIVFGLTDDHGEPLRGGTTLIAVYLDKKDLNWVSVGDSRIYIFRKDEMVQITTDHNYFLKLNMDLENGLIDQEFYMEEAKQGEALLSFIGMGGLLLTDINEVPFVLEEGDTILMCTDGVYRALPEECLKQIMINCKNMNEASNWIEQYIKDVNLTYQDNYTYVLIRVCGKDE